MMTTRIQRGWSAFPALFRDFRRHRCRHMGKLLVLAAACGALQAAVIRGVVVEHISGKPLSRVTVRAQPLPGPGAGPPARVTTNVSGVFEFPPLAGGAYIVTAARTNYVTMQYCQKEWNSAGLPV